MDGPPTLDRYPYVIELATRWSDNDVYGHVNNVTYYSYFDTVANHFLIHEAGLDIAGGAVIGLVVESSCAYHAPLAFPQRLRAGLRVERLGNRAVTWAIGVFGDGDTAAAHGRFVHVFVDRDTRRPVPIPDPMRAAMRRLLPEGAA